MTIRVIADRAQVHWLVPTNGKQTLAVDHAVVYVPYSPVKLGQVTRDSAEGLTPQRVFIERYNDKSAAAGDIVAQDLFVIPKIHGQHFDYDDGIRELIHHLYQQGKIEFDALLPGYQVDNTNSEGLLGYDRTQHFDQLMGIVKQYLGLGTHFDTKSPLTWRWKQEEEIEEICDRLNRHDLCLFAAYTSRGKTKIAIEVASRMIQGGGIVLVTTPITDTKQGFSDNIRNWHFGSDRSRPVTYMDSQDFKKYTAADLAERAQAGELIFVVLTVQDLRWGDSVDDLDLAILRNKYLALDGKIDLWIRDERHSQYNGAVTSTRLGQLRAKKELDLTATPYNCFSLYDRKHIVSRTLLWGLQNRVNTRLPEIGIDALSLAACELSPKIQALYSQTEGYDPRKMFARDGANFLLEAELIELAQRFYNKRLSRLKNPLSINNDTNLSPAAKRCGMWVLPAGANGDGASDYIPDLAALLNTSCGRDIHWVDSYSLETNCPRGVAIGDYVHSLLQSNARRLIILTCGKFLTGTDIPALGHVVLFDKMNSIANFEQLMGRMIREYPLKDQVKLYALAPGAQLQVVMARMALKSAELAGGDPQTILDCVPLSEYRGGSWNVLTSTEILSAVQEWFQEQVRRLIPGVSVLRSIIDADLTAWNGVDLSATKMMLPRSRLNEDIGGKVKEKGGTEKQDVKPAEQQVPAEKIREIIQNVVYEAQCVGYSMNNYDWRAILENPAIRGMFGDGIVDACVKTIDTCPRLETIIREHLEIKQQAYFNLPYTEIYDELFGNSRLKQNIGLVYVPLALAQDMVANLPKKKYNRIMVVNALNGMLPLVLRDVFPDAEIVCGEVFPYFREHLTNLGFTVVDWNGVDMKFDLVIGNPPYVDSSAGKIPIYNKFVEKSMELSRQVVALIIPAGFSTSDEARGNKVRQLVSSPNTKKIKFLGSDAFQSADVNTLYFVLDKTQDSATEIAYKDTHYITTRSQGDYIFKEEILYNILNKCGTHRAKTSWIKFNRIEKVSPARETKTVTQITKSGVTYDFTTYVDDYLTCHKVVTSFLPNASHHLDVVWYVPENVAVKKGYTVCKMDSEVRARNLAAYLRSSLCRAIHTETKTSRTLRTPQLKFIPKVDLNRSWTDQELYTHFQLTPEEIAFIESTVK